MANYEKLWMILMIWLFLVFLAIFYCYICEQRLFPSQKLFDRSLVDTQGLLTDGRCPNQECNHRNLRSGKHSHCHNIKIFSCRFSPGPKRLDLSKFRSSCLRKTAPRTVTQAMVHQLWESSGSSQRMKIIRRSIQALQNMHSRRETCEPLL